jgi:hypothetical protein
LTYLDESGFDRIPVVPYAWQEKGEYIEIKSQPSKRLNLVGILNKNNEFFSYIFETSINSDLILSCIDKFCKISNQKNCFGNGQCFDSYGEKSRKNQEKWESKGLSIFFLPTYSPQLKSD